MSGLCMNHWMLHAGSPSSRLLLDCITCSSSPSRSHSLRVTTDSQTSGTDRLLPPTNTPEAVHYHTATPFQHGSPHITTRREVRGRDGAEVGGWGARGARSRDRTVCARDLQRWLSLLLSTNSPAEWLVGPHRLEPPDWPLWRSGGGQGGRLMRAAPWSSLFCLVIWDVQ